MKRILVMGAGRVSRPCVQHLLKDPNFHVTVVDKVLENAEQAVGNHPRGEALSVEAHQADELVDKADLVISLLPAFLERNLIKNCIDRSTPVIFPNYISPEIKEMDSEAREKGITVLGEIGLDPGIDHMSAIKIIDQARDKGGSLTGFASWCGGLPAPEAATDPIRYKFSWSPEGAINASERWASYLANGQEVHVSGKDLIKNYTLKHIPECGWLEEYPNSDSLTYLDIYNIPEVEDIYRGTLRYPGWCETIACLKKMGMFDERTRDAGNLSYLDLTCELIGAPEGKNVSKALAEHLGVLEYSLVIKNIAWLGLMDDEPLPFEQASPKEIMSDLLLKKLSYNRGERDLVVMLHEFDIQHADGKYERVTSTLVEYGNPDGDSAMARTTGLPVAIAAKLVLRGEFYKPGIHIPVDREIYEPVLKELEDLGIKVKDIYT